MTHFGVLDITDFQSRPMPHKQGEHLWVSMCMFRISPNGGTQYLDKENLLTVEGPGCWWCEQPYTAEIAAESCPYVGHPWWWLSFAETDRFLGVAIIQSENSNTVVPDAHRLGVNPGGEVKFFKIGNIDLVPESHRNRLLDEAETRALGGSRRGEKTT